MSNQRQTSANAHKTLSATPFEIPNPPDEFGRDGGKFYRAYDDLAEELDDDMVKSLKEQLDGILIFAGLFAGVNSAFLALTLPLLSSDSSDDTNALLAQNNAILMQLVTGRNETGPSDPVLPSTTFSPSPTIFIINSLFGLSLAIAIIASFLAVLGRQWLVYYRKRSGSGPDRQRWDQLKRFLAAERWRLELILDDVLPSLLQTALIVFCISFIMYLHHLNPALSFLVGTPMYLGILIFIGSAICTLWDRFCPFHSPLSHLLRWAVKAVPFVLRGGRRAIVSGFKSFAVVFLRHLKRLTRLIKSSPAPNDVRDHESGTGDPAEQTTRRLQLGDFVHPIPIKRWLQTLTTGRKEESLDSLQVITLQRAICTSDDPRTLLYAASNMLGIGAAEQMAELWKDKNFPERFFDQLQNFHSRVLHLGGSDHIEIAAPAVRLYCAAAAHSLLILNTGWENLTDFVTAIYMVQEMPIWAPNEDLRDFSACLIKATLAFTIFQFYTDNPSAETVMNLYSYLSRYSKCLEDGDWRLFCLISWAGAHLTETKTAISPSMDSLRRAYKGDCGEVIQTLEGAFKVLVAKSKELVECERILIDMLQFLGRVIVDKVQSNVSIEQKFALSACWERSVHVPHTGLPEATRPIVRKIRIDLAKVWQQECRKEKYVLH
ncbi:hypothetical protein FRC00_002038 [Tulasnella sp. 408]|nr:hypothetical protein FRC00_002038 [Tulasnella sp. 408]